LAFGDGLIGGVAGEQLTVLIQAKDTRQTSIQYLTTMATVVDYLCEVQEVRLTQSGNFNIVFRGQTSSSLSVGGTVLTLKNALIGMNTIDGVEICDQMNQILPDSALIAYAEPFRIRFTGPSVAGPLPFVHVSGVTADISRIVRGYAPFRVPVQVVQCTVLSGAINLVLDGKMANFTATDTISSVQAALAVLNVGTIVIKAADGSAASSTFCGVGKSMFVEFHDIHGPMNTLTSSVVGVVISTDPDEGAMSGLFPVWGTFQISIHGETTLPISFDASATELALALENLYSVGSLSVTKDVYGVAFERDGVTPVYSSKQYIYSIWSVTFSAVCSGNTMGIASGNCPSSLVNEPLMVTSAGNLNFARSTLFNQESPFIAVQSSRIGYGGNDRLNHDDLPSISLTLHDRSDDSVIIGMNSIQILQCTLPVDPSPIGHFTLQFLNLSLQVQQTTSVATLQSDLNSLLGGRSSVILNGGLYVCSDTTASTELFVSSPSGRGLPLWTVIDSSSMSATVFPSVQPVDDATIVEDHLGLYSITYTPTRAGVFDIFVQINGNDVATDLTAGIKVAPAVEYAATSTHNVSQVNIEGVREYFAIQLRDRFGNELSGPLDPLSSLVIQLNGRSDGCEISQTVVIPVVSSTALPVTNGVYNFWYNPTIAGNYLLSAGLITRGGLKGTYFRRKDLTDPLLPSHSHLYDDYFHNPGWCDGLKSDAFSPFWTFGTVVFCDGGLSGCGCDSTKLDRMLYFDWGNDSP
jgi:hypothetical protein